MHSYTERAKGCHVCPGWGGGWQEGGRPHFRGACPAHGGHPVQATTALTLTSLGKALLSSPRLWSRHLNAQC